jgi:hypothetical protein
MFRLRNIIFVTFGLICSFRAFSQGNIEDLLYQEVDNLNPVYKPVVGFGVGTFNYYGNVQDPKQNPFSGMLGYKVNITTFIDNKHLVRGSLNFMSGSLSGNERSSTNLNRNMNFKSDIMLFGFDLNYAFNNFYKKYRRVHPFISIGVEMMTFNSKIDSFATIEGVNVKYNYWSDGTIHSVPETAANLANASSTVMQRDYTYETDLRSTDWGLSKYPQYSFAIPIDVGLDFWLTDRLMFRVGSSYHIAFSDVIDHVSPRNTAGVVGTKKHDNFMYNYISMQLDLFSSKKTLVVQRLFADVEFDHTLMDDEDADGIFDGWDHCPGTPFGVAVDSLGCPLDNDYDGVPNYTDDEPNTRYGAYVDDHGVEIPEEKLIAMLDMSNAVLHKDVEMYLRSESSYEHYKNVSAKEIPAKFKNVDKNKDGYISFDEILNTIDDFFDFKSDLNSDDIYELNNFFFAQ